MAKKQKTVKELNVEVELLSERLRKLEEKETTKNPCEESKNKVEEIEMLLKINDQKIKDLDKLLLKAQPKFHVIQIDSAAKNAVKNWKVRTE